MTQRFSNNARTSLASFLSDTATSLSAGPGDGDMFPPAGATTASGEDWFKAVLQDDTGDIEIVYVYTRVEGSDVFADMVRGREGTAARAWDSGSVVALRMTAKDLENGLLVVPSGSKMLFMQSAAPMGWTKITDHNNAALRVVSGSVVNGGSVDFTSVFSPKAVDGTVEIGDTALTEAQMPSHTHQIVTVNSGGMTSDGKLYTGLNLNFGTSAYIASQWNDRSGYNEVTLNSKGSGAAHTHTAEFTGSGTIDLSVKYVDVILAEKD